jgi:thioredoxin 1
MTLEITQVDFLSRLLWALAIIGGGISLYGLLNRWSLLRARGKSSGLESARPGVPVLLYFTTPTCAPCKTVQRPAIRRLSEQLGDQLQVIEVDATARPDLASHWGVMSVPTTFLLDASRQPRHVNHGVAKLDKLIKQFNDME